MTQPDLSGTARQLRAELPIGVFDSGIGGLTVLKEIMQQLPHESTVYFGDTGRTPYGSKSDKTVIQYSEQITRFLLRRRVRTSIFSGNSEQIAGFLVKQPVKLIVIACNTASASSVEAVRAIAGDVPVLGVIEAGARAAVSDGAQRIGVIGTKGTVRSNSYRLALERVAPGPVEIWQQACPLFVGLAEEGWWDGPLVEQIAERYLGHLRQHQLDTLVLGCTHYPLLREAISKTIGRQVRIIESGAPVAHDVRKALAKAGLLRQNTTHSRINHQYFCSDDPETFSQLANLFLADTVTDVARIPIEQY